MGEITSEDRELAAAARRKAGGPTKLARLFHVTKQAVNDWGRRRPVPRHLRPRLQEFVDRPLVAMQPAAPYRSATVRPSRRKAVADRELTIDDLAHELLRQRSALESLVDELRQAREEEKKERTAVVTLLEALRLSLDRQRGDRLRRGAEGASAG